MATKQEDIVLIDSYLRGELDPAQQSEFEQRKSDPEFAKLLEQMQSVFEHVRVAGRDDLRREMRRWDSSKKNGTHNSPPHHGRCGSFDPDRRSGILPRTTSVTARSDRTQLPGAISEYRRTYPERAVMTLTRTRYEQAFQLYEMGYYNKAMDLFRTLDQSDEAVQFYTAVTLLLDDEYDEAIDALQKIDRQPGHRFNAAAKWYTALSYLMKGDKSEGVLLLNELSEGNSPYAQRARQVIDDLR